ncbi:DUF1624 domain-containing protein [Simiduia sp. 21SJ11W-1]|uniref:heparan-alpha-glucosaminide N-acetyltransferase domain-containing protein n=1 Tax=Simiduia sp. 21SJ11W-1 TaxID=2909669 RepID=UPI0020A17C16|nr:heparan-alpha-glucosaminide N-acetyltransferase domain-containing protein [Simiduia sp. 21SJ11W-1]UTA48960.1 DUF1624 domain-containing protein [Simiduia sp. 21SJ11W-1]
MQTHTPARIHAIDSGRGLAVLLMVLVHTLWMYADHSTQTRSWLGTLVHIIGKGSAAFLICMGVSLVLARNQSASYRALRGLFILALGFMLNSLKFVLPIAMGVMPHAFIQAYGWQAPLTFTQYQYLLFTGDILQLAGVALLLLALAQPLLTKKRYIVMLGLMMAACAKVFAGMQLGITGLDYLLRLLFSDSWQVYFPAFPWMSFILFGMFLGRLISERGQDANILARLPWVAVPLLIIGGALCYTNFSYHFGDFFHLGPGGVFYLLGINLLLLWAIHTLLNKPTTFTRLLSYCSRRVTSLYIIQWTLICWGMALVGYKTLNSTQTLLAMVCTLAATFTVQQLVDLARSFLARPSAAAFNN